MKFKKPKEKSFGLEGIKGWIYNSRDDFKNANVVLLEVKGRHGKTKTTLSDRIYYVLEGRGEFIINDKTILVEKTDVVIIPKNTPYDFKGNMRLFLVNTPAFDADYEINLEKSE